MECNNNVIEGSLEQVQESVEYVKSKIGNMVPQLGKLIEMAEFREISKILFSSLNCHFDGR